MNILLISSDFSAADLCVRLGREGHSVRAYVSQEEDRFSGAIGMVELTKSWRHELGWVGKGKNGLIIFDSTGHGETEEKLRKEGYSVVGSCVAADRIEEDRAYGQKILQASDIKILPSQKFTSIDTAIKFIESHKGRWVVKQNGHTSKIFNYVGKLEDGSDVIQTLKNYRKHDYSNLYSIELQQYVDGIEIGVGRFFNGVDWVGPIEINFEHKDLCNGNIGPKTYEMGTLMWFDDNEKNKLFQKTLAKLKPYLRKIDFHGDVDINCIVNEHGIFPLEITPRFGFPALQLQCVLANSPMGEFLKALADGEQYDFRYKKEYGVVVLVAMPPFPYENVSGRGSFKGTEIFFREPLTEEEKNRIHFEEVSRRKTGEYYISGDSGFVLHVSGIGKTVENARKHAYDLIHKVIVPKMFYRTDIGLKYIEEDRMKLKKWGYL